MQEQQAMALKAFFQGLIAPPVVKHNTVAAAGLGTAAVMDILQMESALKILVLVATLAYATFHAAREVLAFLRDRRENTARQEVLDLEAEDRAQKRAKRKKRRGPGRAALLLLAAATLATTTGCGGPLIRGKAPALAPGTATMTRAGSNVVQTVKQPENPSQSATQTYSRTEAVDEVLPAGTTVFLTTASTNDAGHLETRSERYTLPAPLVRKKHVTETTGATIGAAQKDEARGLWVKAAESAEKLGAKLRSLRPVQALGGLLILAALAMFHPVVRAVTQSTTLQMVTGATGVALIFLPTIVVGNEGWILAAGILIPAAYFLIWRHGKLQGLADANKNGIPDFLEGAKAGALQSRQVLNTHEQAPPRDDKSAGWPSGKAPGP